VKRQPDPWPHLMGVMIFVVACGVILHAAGCEHQ
jgi:hypothetical protein